MGLSISRPGGSESRSGPEGYRRSVPTRTVPSPSVAVDAGSVTSAGSKYTGSQRLRPSISNSSQDRLSSRCCCRTRVQSAMPGATPRTGSRPTATASRTTVYPTTISATVASMLNCSRSANGAQAKQITRAPSAACTG